MREYYDRRAPLLDRAYRTLGEPRGWMLEMEGDLRAIFAPRATDLRITMGEFWWWLRYIVRD